MGLYNIKVLRDEEGIPFMPVTCEESIIGGKYTLSVFDAEKTSNGHYVITFKGLSESALENKIIGLVFNDVADATYPSFLRLDSDEENINIEHPIYNYDGTTYLDLSSYNDVIALFALKDNKWILVKTGSAGSSKHGITGSNHVLMTDRGVLWFDKFDISDESGYGATKISNPNWSYQNIAGITGLISSDSWIPLTSSIIEAPVAGTYRLILHLELNDITTINREVGIKIGSKEDWTLQYKRLNHTFIIEGDFNAGDNLVPSIYVDKISSTDTINIEECDFYIEHINVQQ